MKKQDNTIESLVAGGLIGAALGTWLAKDKEEGAVIGALLGAVFSATHEANKQALKTHEPVLIAENNNLYRVLPGGEKQFIKALPKITPRLGKHFKLK